MKSQKKNTRLTFVNKITYFLKNCDGTWVKKESHKKGVVKQNHQELDKFKKKSLTASLD